MAAAARHRNQLFEGLLDPDRRDHEQEHDEDAAHGPSIGAARRRFVPRSADPAGFERDAGVKEPAQT